RRWRSRPGWRRRPRWCRPAPPPTGRRSPGLPGTAPPTPPRRRARDRPARRRRRRPPGPPPRPAPAPAPGRRSAPGDPRPAPGWRPPGPCCPRRRPAPPWPHRSPPPSGPAVVQRLSAPARRSGPSAERRARALLPDPVDVHVHLLVVEADQPRDLLALGQRRAVGPGEVLVRPAVDLHRPVARGALVRAGGP